MALPGTRHFSGSEHRLDNNPSADGGFFNRVTKSSPQEQASDAIQAGLTQAGEEIQAGTETARGDLQPFTDAGVSQLGAIQGLLTPEGQKDFVQNNPFFEMLAQDAQRRIFNQAGASGRGFAGGTAQALQNSIALLGPELVNQNINQRQGLVNTGFGAATGQANISSLGSNTLAELAASGGETEAAGILGLENTRRADKADSRASRSNTLGTIATLGALALSDRRFKEHITPIFNNGVQWYSFKYINGPWSIGVMADEVPHATIEIDGIKYVDYGKI